jgi:SAM-dependent methyltransferase
MTASAPAAPATPAPFDYACTVCGQPFPADRFAVAGAICGCGAGRRTMELAAAVLHTHAHGIPGTLLEFAEDTAISPPRVLDLTLDTALSLTTPDRLVRGDPFGGGKAAEGGTGAKDDTIPVDLAALPAADASLDLVLMRDVLFWVPDLPALLAESTRVLADGGHAVFQENFAWQFPEITVEADPAGEPKRRPAGGTRKLERRVIGADILDLMAAAGLPAFGYRPGLAVDPHYRHLLLIARRVPRLS